MMGLTSRDNDQPRARARRGRMWRRAGALVIGACALAVGTGVAAPGPASAVTQCPPGSTLLLNVCIVIGRPTPTPTTIPSTPPTTAAPSVSLPPVTLPPVTVPPVLNPTSPVSVPDAAQHLLDLINGERQRAGLGALTSRDDVVAIALEHSLEMAQKGDIFHSTSYFGSAVRNLLNAAVRGENVAYNGDIDTAHARLMASAGHRANILDARFSVVGIAVVKAPDGRFFITQDFLQPAGAPRAVAAPKAPPAPRAAAPAASRKAATPKPAPTPTVPAPTTTVAPPPTTVAPPAPAPTVPSPPVVTLEPASTAGAAIIAHHGGATTVPLGTLAAVLLASALCACCVLPRRVA